MVSVACGVQHKMMFDLLGSPDASELRRVVKTSRLQSLHSFINTLCVYKSLPYHQVRRLSLLFHHGRC